MKNNKCINETPHNFVQVNEAMASGRLPKKPLPVRIYCMQCGDVKTLPPAK